MSINQFDEEPIAGRTRLFRSMFFSGVFWCGMIMLLQSPNVQHALSQFNCNWATDAIYILGFVPKGYLIDCARRQPRRGDVKSNFVKMIFYVGILAWFATGFVLVWTDYGRANREEVYMADATITLFLLGSAFLMFNSRSVSGNREAGGSKGSLG